MIKCSVIVPVFNEDRTIVQILEKVSVVTVEGVEFEVVVVDDGSTDGTRDLLKGRPELYATLLLQDRNGGKGAAVKAGLAAATGDYVLFQDADLEYDPADYPTLLEPVTRLGAEVVIGSRMLAPRMTRVSYFWHKAGNRIITLAFNVLFNVTFTDAYSCYLMFRRDLVSPSELKTEGWEQQAEILGRVVPRAKALFEVPISYYGRGYGEGKKIRWWHAFIVLWTILRSRLFLKRNV